VKDLKDKVVVITGSASGIGQALAVRLAQEGCALALVDVDQDGLTALARQIGSGSDILTIHCLDVSDREQVYETARAIHTIHGRVDILINCAGVAVMETIEDITYEDFQWVMDVNFWGAVHTTKAFLPFLKQRQEAHIVNISSVDGIVPNPNGGAYAAAKAAMKSFSETLYQELQGSNISVTCVLPGGVKTNLHRNARFFKIACQDMTHEECIAFFADAAFTSAEQTAKIIVKAIRNKKSRVVIGIDAKLIDFCARVAPLGSTALAGHMSRNLRSKKMGFCQRLIQRFLQRS
jgi:short-subunit dehydrogenase